jgi:hypothetical protein
MSDIRAVTSRATAAPPNSQEDQRVARPVSVITERRPSLHDRQRELVRASLIARPPAAGTTRLS